MFVLEMFVDVQIVVLHMTAVVRGKPRGLPVCETNSLSGSGGNGLDRVTVAPWVAAFKASWSRVHVPVILAEAARPHVYNGLFGHCNV